MAKKQKIEVMSQNEGGVEHEEKQSKDGGSVTVEMALQDFQKSIEYWNPWRKAALEDFDFAFGDQWKDADVKALEDAGVKAITYNEIQANLFLLSGLQRQNRSDYKAFPEGEEDSVKAEIATRLLKNIMKVTRGEQKLSEQFDSMCICGMGFIDPFIDYTFDIVHGDMKIKNQSVFKYYPDPDFDEYDMSDGKYLIKHTTGLSKNQLKSMFPENHKKIDKLKAGKFESKSGNAVGTQGDSAEPENKRDDYGSQDPVNMSDKDKRFHERDASFELLEYFYQNWIRKYMVVDQESGQTRDFDSKDEALKAIDGLKAELEQAILMAQDPETAQSVAAKLQTFDDPENGLVLIERLIPEIWIKSIVAPNSMIEDSRVWSYPRFKKYPIISMFGHRTNVRLSKRQNMIQGVVRSLKDPQIELNKRKTQKLRHLNSSTNSGWIGPKGCYIDVAQWKKFAGSPGVRLEWDPNVGEPKQIFPQPISQGHTQLEVEASDAIKKISGINADLLAMNEQQASGKAINLRTKQGLVMVQKLFDNASETKKLLGLFFISQFPEIYTAEKAMKVLGQSWLEQNFTHIQTDEAGPVIDQDPNSPGFGQPVEFYDEELAKSTIGDVLNDAGLGIFDIAVGESISAETIKMANFEHIMEMIKAGVPLPPDVIVDNSLLDNAQKEKIKQGMINQQQSAGQPK